MTINPSEIPQHLIYPEADPVQVAIENSDSRARLESIDKTIATVQEVEINAKRQFGGMVNTTIDSLNTGYEIATIREQVTGELHALTDSHQISRSKVMETHQEKLEHLSASQAAETAAITEKQQEAEAELRRQLAEMEARHANERHEIAQRQQQTKVAEQEANNSEYLQIVHQQDVTRTGLEAEFTQLTEVLSANHESLVTSSKKNEGALEATVGKVAELIQDLHSFRGAFQKKVVGVAETEAYFESSVRNVDRLTKVAEGVRQEERRMKAIIDEIKTEYNRMHGYEQDLSLLMENDATVSDYRQRLSNRDKNYEAARNRLDHAENVRDRLRDELMTEQERLDSYFAEEYPQKHRIIESLGRLTKSLALAAEDVHQQYAIVQRQKNNMEELVGAVRSSMPAASKEATVQSQVELIPQQCDPVDPVVFEVEMRHENGAASLIGEYNHSEARFLLNQLIKTPADN